MSRLTTNISPSALDMRHIPDAASAYQPVHRTSVAPAQTKLDPMRAVIVANLEMAGIVTNGKNDAQLLAEYGQLVQRTTIEQAYHADQRARRLEADAWGRYDINDVMGET